MLCTSSLRPLHLLGRFEFLVSSCSSLLTLVLRSRKPSRARFGLILETRRRPPADEADPRTNAKIGPEVWYTVGFIWDVSQRGYWRSGDERRPFSGPYRAYA